MALPTAIGSEIYSAGSWTNAQGVTVTEATIVAGETLTFGAVPAIEFAEDGDGNKLINNLTDLKKLQAAVADGETFAGVTFKQTADIDMADAGIWYGIGPKNDLANSFAGKYDGQNHRIYNITYAHVEYCGLFRGLNEGAELKNLTIESLGIAAKADGDDDRFGGGLFVGFAQGVTLENLTAKGALYGIWVANEKQGLGYNGGGIAMKVNGTSLVRNCTNEAEIVLSYTKAGGIVGFTQSISKNETTTFENCVNKGKIEILASGNNSVGGILGWANASVVMNNCASLGEIDIADGLTGTVVGSMIGQYDGGVCTVGAGNTTTVLDMVPSKGAVAISGFNFATVANGVATFAPIAKDGTVFTAMLDSAETNKLAATQTVAIKDGPGAFTGEWEAADETVAVTKTTAAPVTTWAAVAAAASVDGVGYATVAGALAAAGDTGAEVKLFADYTTAIDQKNLCLNCNGFKCGTITPNGNTIVKNTVIGAAAANSVYVTVPAESTITYDGVTFVRQDLVVQGAGDANFIGCTFSNTHDSSGNEVGESTADQSYTFHSFDLQVNLSGTLVATNCTFYQNRRCAISTGNVDAKAYIYDCVFDGTKCCLTWAERTSSEYKFPATQLKRLDTFVMEGCTFRGQWIAEPICVYCASDPAAGGDTYMGGTIVFNNNVVESTIDHAWYIYLENQNQEYLPPAINVYFGQNDIAEGVDMENGRYKKQIVSNAIYPYCLNMALPSEYATVWAWVNSENAEKPFKVNDTFVATLENVQKDDTVIALPGADLSTLDTENFSLTPVDTFLNKWTVADALTEVAVTINWNAAGWTGFKYTITDDATVYDAVNGTPIAVGLGKTITVIPTIAENYIAGNPLVAGDIVADGLAFTVKSDASIPTASITFASELAAAKVGDKLFGAAADAFAYACTNDAVAVLLKDMTSTVEWQPAGTPPALKNGDYKIDANGKLLWVATDKAMTKVAGDGYDTYHLYENLPVAWTNKGSSATYIVGYAETTAGAITLTKDNLTISGTFCTRLTPPSSGSLAAGVVVADETAEIKTSSITDAGFEFVAEAVATDPIPPLPVDPTPTAVSNLIDSVNYADKAALQAVIGGDAAKYTAFKTWADGIGAPAVIASPHAADSFQLGLTALLENAPVSEIKTIAKTSDTALTLTFEIKDGKAGDAVEVADAAKTYVASLVKCAEDVGFATPIPADVTVTVSETTLTATVALPENKPAAFMKVAK